MGLILSRTYSVVYVYHLKVQPKSCSKIHNFLCRQNLRPGVIGVRYVWPDQISPEIAGIREGYGTFGSAHSSAHGSAHGTLGIPVAPKTVTDDHYSAGRTSV